ncbi:FAD-dependent oxidoreductase (plasmid) [Streptomyces sp. NBC_00190]|uniref:FAD-dependent oxidoreductase n=1 Tax=unclassified Streptomyces TaxID=2593676 RepID=UPI002E2875C2|nr:FAD-dependent oxidoreductase [Streptomyces sp. NBC_00190]
MVTFVGRQPVPDPASVLVVGAGPVGLTAAHELARRGVRVRLVDAAPGPARTSRAVAVHPRTLETFDQMGVAEPVLASGRHNKAFTMYAGGRRLVRLEADYSSMPTRFPFTVVIEQTRTEELLREACGRLGVTVEWDVRLTGFSQDPGGVRARLEHGDGRAEEYRAAWLVGCDGGHSTVRKELGLPLIGESSETWELADAQVAMDLPPDTIYWVHTGGQALMMVPYQREGHWRLLDTAPVAGPGIASPAQARESAARFSQRLSAGLGREVLVGEPEWSSVFTFQQRMVPAMHQGRVFVAGDAAHVHSPASGQGMNTGIQEAYNLAWKLAMVARGQAGRPLLATYGQERVPVGRKLLGSTRQATFLVQFKNALAGVMLPAVFSVVRGAPPLRRAIQRKVLGGMSGLLLGYPDSPLTSTDGGLRQPAGSRAAAIAAGLPAGPAATALHAELRDPRWTLLYAPDGDEASLAAEAAAGVAGDWLSVRAVGARPGTAPAPLPDPDGLLRDALGLASGGWVLIRPDGYLAASGPELTGRRLERALSVLGPVLLQRSSVGSPAPADTVEATTRVLEGRR